MGTKKRRKSRRRFEDALRYAAELHRKQKRKGTSIPYVSHLLAVTAIVIEHGGDEDQAIAALLHDAVEDQGGAATREAIRERFGERVTTLVDALSDTDEIPKPPWRERKEQYLAHLKGADKDVMLISMADKLHNVRAILRDVTLEGEQVWERFKGGKEGTLWYYRALADFYGSRAEHWDSSKRWLAQEIDQVVGELERVAGQ